MSVSNLLKKRRVSIRRKIKARGGHVSGKRTKHHTTFASEVDLATANSRLPFNNLQGHILHHAPWANDGLACKLVGSIDCLFRFYRMAVVHDNCTRVLQNIRSKCGVE